MQRTESECEGKPRKIHPSFVAAGRNNTETVVYITSECGDETKLSAAARFMPFFHY